MQDEKQLTPEEFAQQIRKDFPEYKDKNDVEFTKIIIEKYPVYKGWVNFSVSEKKKPVIPENTESNLEEKKQLSPSEFAQQIRKDFPKYRDLDDVEFTKIILGKYPTYRDWIDFNKPEKENSRIPENTKYNSENEVLNSYGNASIQKFDSRPKTIDRKELLNYFPTEQKINDTVDKKKDDWRNERSKAVETAKQNIEQGIQKMSLEDIVQGRSVVSNSDHENVELLNRAIQGKWYETNQGIDLNREYTSHAKEERLKGIIENELQPEFTIARKAKEIIKNNPEISPDFAEKKIKDDRLKEAIGLLPSDRARQLHQYNVQVAELKEKLQADPSNKRLENEYFDAKLALNKEMEGASWWKSNEDNTAMFDENGNPTDTEFQQIVNEVGKEAFLKDLTSRYKKFDKASTNKEEFTKLWNDTFEKFKAIESQWQTAKDEHIEAIRWNHFSQKEQKEKREKAYEFWKNQYTNAKMDFSAINEILLTNIDPSSVKRHWYQDLRTGIDQGFSYNIDSYSTDQIAEVYQSVANDNNFSITKAQKLNAKLDFEDEALRTIGSSLPAMAEIMGTTYITQGIGTAPALTRLAALSRLRYGRLGQKSFNFLKGAVLEGAAFELAPNDDTTFAMGVGENTGQNVFEGLESKLGTVRNKYLRFLTRIGVGSISETTAEYVGDFTNELTKNGFDIEEAITEVVGQNVDEALRKLALTAITTTAFSTGSNITASVFSKIKKEAETLPDSDGKKKLIDAIDEANEVNNNILVNQSENENLTEVVNREQQKINEVNQTSVKEDKEQSNDNDSDFDEDVFDAEELGEFAEIPEKNNSEETKSDEDPTEELPEENQTNQRANSEEVAKEKESVNKSFSLPEAAQKPAIEEQTSTKTIKSKPYVTNNKNYQLKRGKNGMIEVFNRDGSKSGVSGVTKRKYVDEYIKKTNFDIGNKAIDENTTLDQDPAQRVADKSTNPLEVAETIVQNNFDIQLDDKTEAIARNVNQVSRKSFEEYIGYSKKKEGVSQSYFSKKGKALDKIQMDIISDLGYNYDAKTADAIVSINDITDFILKYNGATEYLNQKSELASDLLSKFEILTGLRATQQNIRAIASINETTTTNPRELIDWEEIKNAFNSDEEIPFKIDSANKANPTKTAKLDKLLTKLQKTFPKNKLVMDKRLMIEALNQLSKGVTTANGSQFLKTSKGQVYGFVHPKTGAVYVDPEFINYETPIHEFGHIWVTNLKENNTPLYQKGIDLIRDSVYHHQVRSNPGYADLSLKEQLEEALVTAIGDRGAKFWGEDKNVFQRFLEKVKQWLSTTFFKDVKNTIDAIDLDTFLDRSLSDILSGRDLKIDPNELSSDGKVKYMILGSKGESSSENPDSKDSFKNLQIENEKARILLNKTTNALRALKTKTAKASAIRVELKNALKDYIDNSNIKNMRRHELDRIIATINKAQTKAEFDAALNTFEEVAISAQRRGIKDKYKQRLKEIKESEINGLKQEIQEEIKAIGMDFFSNKISDKNIKGLRKSELQKIYSKLESAKTQRQVKNLAKELEDVFYDLESRRTMASINKILKRKLTKRESGRRKANLTDERSTKIISGTKSILKKYAVNRKSKDRSEKRTFDLEFLSDLWDRQKELLGKVATASEAELNELTSLNISIGILNSKTVTSPKEKLQSLQESEQELQQVYEEGRSNHLDWVLRKKNERNDFIKSAVEANNINNKSITPSKKDVVKKRNALIANFMRLGFDWTSGKNIGDLDSVLQIIDKKGNRNNNEGFAAELTENLKTAATNKEFQLREYSKQLKQKQREIFGKIKGKGSDFVMQNILGKKHNFTVKRPSLNIATGKLDYENLEDIDITLSESQLLNLWMHYKNEELHDGFISAGYDAEFMLQLDTIIHPKTKEYGNFLFDFYDEYYSHINTTYKKMYGHSLGKPKFYAGKLSRYGYDEETVDLMNGISTARTTAGGSTKERLNNKLPIQPVDVNIAIQQYLYESEHFVQYAAVHAKYDAMLKDKRFQNSIMANNKYVGDAILEQLAYYRDLEMVRGGKERETFRVFDVLMGNIVKSTLAIKPKIAITQTLSIPNVIKFLPRGKNAIKGYNPVTYIKDAKHIFKNSKYIKNRLDSNTLNKAITGLNSVSNEDVFGTRTGNSVKQFIRAYDAIQNALMINVKVGDLIGVMGSFPLYTAWKAEYLSRGLTESLAEEKAMKKFESSVDRAQQGQTKFSKSKLQNNPIGKMFSMFATSPMQNYRNAISSYIEVSRYLRKNQQMKGSLARHILSIANFSVAQPLLYTWVAGRLQGGLAFLLQDDDEPTESEKAMLSSLILRNTSSMPMVGSALTLIVDELLEKERSYGGLLSNPVIQEADNVKKYYQRAKKSNTQKSKEDNYRMMLRSFYKLLTGLPVETAKKYKDLFTNLDKYEDKYDAMEMLWLKLGHGTYAIDLDREEK